MSEYSVPAYRTVLDEACYYADAAEQVSRTGSSESVVRLINVLESLGIDPGQPLEEFHHVLQMGRRASSCQIKSWQHHENAVYCGETGVVLGEEAVWLATWIQTGL